VGVGLAYLINRSTGPVIGQPIAFRVEGALLAGAFAMALLISLGAALLPARRAARVPGTQALQGG
jgi:ABC-type lipoprotein release transport system permease subunit